MGRGRWIAVAAVLALIGGATAFWFLALGPIREHRHWYDRVRADLDSLADKRPADVSPGPVTVATIDWIWDEYARITNGGRLYGERYRPTLSSDLQHARPGFWGIRVRQRGHAEPGAAADGGGSSPRGD
jgi:hypothetical protein